MMRVISFVVTVLLAVCGLSHQIFAEEGVNRETGEELYERLSTLSREGENGAQIFDQLHQASSSIDWSDARTITCVANLRQLEVPSATDGALPFYLVREESGNVHILALPEDRAQLEEGADSPYAGLAEVVGKKTTVQARVIEEVVGGVSYSFLQLTAAPEQLLLDRLFFIAIVLLLFLTMVGMGLTLTIGDFSLVFKKPAGMILGPIFQFGLFPLMAMIIGRIAGYYETYPFIFLGLILVASSPGGVTSNLMTYLGKGDLALSVSLTAVCTVLALFFTPFLLTLYSGNIPEFSLPISDVFTQMLVLVIVPLFIGMTIRWKAEKFAKKSEKVFALVGVFSLLVLIAVGIFGNLEKFSDTNRYGLKFYLIVFALTFFGMLASGLLSKLFRIKNFQVRAIALECGLRNASLAMTIAILIQDRMGDFYSSMLFTSGIFGLWMYVAGAITIWIFPKWLPVTQQDLEELRKARSAAKEKESVATG